VFSRTCAHTCVPSARVSANQELPKRSVPRRSAGRLATSSSARRFTGLSSRKWPSASRKICSVLRSSISSAGIRDRQSVLACLEILHVFRARAEVGIPRPFLGAPAHVAAVAYPEQQGALGAGDPFVQFAGRMHDKG